MDIKEYLKRLEVEAMIEAMIDRPVELGNKEFITYYRDRDFLKLKKLHVLYDDYQRKSLFIRTDVYPLLWIYYQAIEDIKIQYHRFCWLTYNCCVKLNGNKDFIPYNEYAPKNPFKLVWRLIKSKW